MIRQLAQLRPSTTSAEVLFSPAQNRQYHIAVINVTNVSGAPVDVSIFHDADGTTFDETTAILWAVNLNANSTLQFETTLADYKSAGALAVKVSVANAATFTVYGEIDGERL